MRKVAVQHQGLAPVTERQQAGGSGWRSQKAGGVKGDPPGSPRARGSCRGLAGLAGNRAQIVGGCPGLPIAWLIRLPPRLPARLLVCKLERGAGGAEPGEIPQPFFPSLTPPGWGRSGCVPAVSPQGGAVAAPLEDSVREVSQTEELCQVHYRGELDLSPRPSLADNGPRPWPTGPEAPGSGDTGPGPEPCPHSPSLEPAL